jgi:spectrin beta
MTPQIHKNCFDSLLQISPDKFLPVENGEVEREEEYVEEVVDVPKEIEVEEVVEKEVMQDVMETRKIPQVKASYAYKGQGMKVDKGEVSGRNF